MPDDTKQRDIDFLLEFREFKGEVNTKLDRALSDIKDLKDDTSLKLSKHDSDLYSPDGVIGRLAKRIEYLENYKGAIVVNSSLLWSAWGVLLTILLYHIFKTSP